jgi:LuxR family maltose regulon positive regulatory protein
MAQPAGGEEEMAALLAAMHKRSAADDGLAAELAALLSRFAAAGIVIDTARPQPPALRLTEREQQILL